jgi:hypothetical protein
MRVAGHRCEVQVWRCFRQPAQEILDIRFVAGSLPAEYVGVDQHVDHAAASR